MHQSTRQFLLNAIAVATLATGVGVAVAADKTLDIGISDSLTGPGAVYGLPQSNAVKMAADEINAQGGIKAGADT